MADRIRWGIAATGGIAAGSRTASPRPMTRRRSPVASRSAERADAFGAEFDIPHRYGSYEDLAADDDVDVVYVATPHSRHEADTMLFLEAGKHVLCEKPFALNQRQAQRMIDTARAWRLRDGSDLVAVPPCATSCSGSCWPRA